MGYDLASHIISCHVEYAALLNSNTVAGLLQLLRQAFEAPSLGRQNFRR